MRQYRPQIGKTGHLTAKQEVEHGSSSPPPAMWWICRAGRADAFRAAAAHVVKDIAKVARSERRLDLRLARESTVEELAVDTGFAVERVEELHGLAREAISLDTPVGEEGAKTVSDLVADTGAGILPI